MKAVLKEHDQLDTHSMHQGLVLARGIPEAKEIAQLWRNEEKESECEPYITNSSQDIRDKFKAGKLCVLVVTYHFAEEFDRKQVSVVGILRNVPPASRVYFSQFVGQAARKLHPGDSVTATVISHTVHDQRPNYDAFRNEHESVAGNDPEELEDANERAEGTEGAQEPPPKRAKP